MYLKNQRYKCQACGKWIYDEDGVTTLGGEWVCDSASCRTLDNENDATIREGAGEHGSNTANEN